MDMQLETNNVTEITSIVSKRRRNNKKQVTWKDHIFPALRLMRGMTSKEVAKKCNLCPSTITKIRNLETKHPRFETIAKIVDAFGGEIKIVWPESVEKQPPKRTRSKMKKAA